MKVLDDNLLRVEGDSWAMLAQKCMRCGHVAYPRKRVCPCCFSEELAEQVLSKTGVLHSFSYTYLGPNRLGLPYAIALVDLPEKIRLLGILDHPESERERVSVGAPIDLVLASITPTASLESVYCYKFHLHNPGAGR